MDRSLPFSPEPQSPEPVSVPPDAVEAALADVERAMVRIRRSMSRRTLGQRLARDLGASFDLALLGVVDAVEQGPDAAGEVTVGAVGERLGIDPSRASRLVSAAIEAGYLRRATSRADGRRSPLELTEAGRDLARAAHQARRSFFDGLMRDWSGRDRVEFARLLTRFVCALGDARTS